MFEIRDDRVDVEKIMATIRENLKRRGAGGGNSPDSHSSNTSPCESSLTSSGIASHHMNLLRLLQDPKPQGPIASHGNRLIELVKRLIRRILGSYHRAIFARQAEFNANLVRLVAELLETQDKSSGDRAAILEDIQARFQTLQAEQAARAQQSAEQAEVLTGLTARVETLQTEQAVHAQQSAEQAAALATRLQTLQAEQAVHAQQSAEQAKRMAQQTEALALLTTRLETLQAEHGRIAVQLESQFAEVVNRLSNQHRTSEDLAAKHVDLGRRLEEQRQEMILQKRRLDLILSEIRKKIGGKRELVSKVLAQKERLMDHSYFLFENRHRGSLEEIKKRQEVYLPIFKERTGPSPSTGMAVPSIVLDIGCGRGEFLELLRDHGIPAKGIDVNEDMVHFCKGRGLDVEQASALAYLEDQADDSLGGVIACQVIEHLPVDGMMEFVKLCYQKLKQGGRVVFETVNPLSILVSATNFYLDLSHVRQIHPIALQFLAEAIGFIDTEVKFLSPYSDDLKLQLLSGNDPDFRKLNENLTRLNDILFGYQDYALICSK